MAQLNSTYINGKLSISGALNGFNIEGSSSKGWFNQIPVVRSDGVMEVGKYIDFHVSNNDNSDYTVRLTVDSGSGVLTLPNKTGTIAITDDVNKKQDALSDSQKSAVNSGITSDLVTKLNKLPNLESAVSASWNWGQLISSNGYTQKFCWNESAGGSVGFAAKSGQTSMQIDGRYYDQEGAYRLVDTKDLESASVNYAASAGSATTATNLANTPSLLTNGNTIAVKAGEKTSSYITVPYASSAGSATTASNAYNDQSGNNIATYYAKKADYVAKSCFSLSGTTLTITIG